MAAPSAAGLFRRAIVQSGGVHVHSIDEAERVGGTARRGAGRRRVHPRGHWSRSPSPSCWRRRRRSRKRRPDPGLIPLPFLPVVDGVFLPAAPADGGGTGAAAGVDLLIGTNRDELALFGLGRPELIGDR